MSDQPKPTDEWTLETIAILQAHGGIDAIVAAHNAALAAERKKREHIERELGCAFDRMVHDYNRQLATERELVQRLRLDLSDPPLDVQEAVIKKLKMDTGNCGR